MLLSFISTDCRNNEIQIQMTEIIFLCWVSGLFLNEMEVIQKWIGVEPLNLHNQLSQQRCCWDADVSGVCPSGRGLQGSPSTHWRNYVSWLGEYLKVLQVGSWGTAIWAISAQTAATVTQALISGIKWALTLLNLYSRALQNLTSYLKWCHMSWLWL